MREFDRMITLLNQSWYLRDQIVPCLVGPVGIGKTAAVRQHAENVGAKHVVTIIASQILPSEVSGITMPDSKTKSMEIYDHYKLSHLEDGDILFFDELLEADQSVLSACLTLIESRMMMSGKLLPDIQIIAATNPTVQPVSLRENIRQRFMFARFELDREQTHDYIYEQTGFDLPQEILNMLSYTGSDYNILSPRSLTKLCLWMNATPDDQLEVTANVIDSMWGNLIGSSLMEAKLKAEYILPEVQVRRKVLEVVSKTGNVPDMEKFKDCTFEEMLETLQSLPEWNEIAAILEDEQVEEIEIEKEITF